MARSSGCSSRLLTPIKRQSRRSITALRVGRANAGDVQHLAADANAIWRCSPHLTMLKVSEPHPCLLATSDPPYCRFFLRLAFRFSRDIRLRQRQASLTAGHPLLLVESMPAWLLSARRPYSNRGDAFKRYRRHHRLLPILHWPREALFTAPLEPTCLYQRRGA